MTSSLMIRDKIKTDYIASGKCGGGDKLPTIRELAKEYGVSYVTVIEAVRILDQEGKVVKRQGSGVYVLKDSAQAERYPIAKKIGYITNCFAQKGAYGYKILDGVERIACQKGYNLEIANSTFSLLKEKEAVAKMINGGVGGIVLYPVPGRDLDHEYLAKEFIEIPMVVVDLAQPEMQRPSVVFDNDNAGYELTKHLIAKGSRKIVFFQNILNVTTYRSSHDRISGAQRAVETASISHELNFSIETWQGDNLEAMFSKLEMLMGSENRPDAIINVNDSAAAAVFFWLTSNGYKVPSEIEIVGFDNVMPEFVPWFNLSDGYQYRWPTTNPDFTRLGERAVELLLETMQTNNKIIREIVLPCSVLIQRHNANKKSFPKIAIAELI